MYTDRDFFWAILLSSTEGKEAGMGRERRFGKTWDLSKLLWIRLPLVYWTTQVPQVCKSWAQVQELRAFLSPVTNFPWATWDLSFAPVFFLPHNHQVREERRADVFHSVWSEHRLSWKKWIDWRYPKNIKKYKKHDFKRSSYFLLR